MISKTSSREMSASVPSQLQVTDEMILSRRTGLARLDFSEGTLLGGSRLGRVIAIDPVMSVLWDSMDGATAFGDLLDDLISATGGPVDESREYLEWFTRALMTDGFLESSDSDVQEVEPEFPLIPADSCLGKRIGLGRMEIAQVRAADRPFRAGATDSKILEALDGAVDLMPHSTGPLESFYYRVTPGRGRTRRLQQVFNTEGDLLFASHDLDEATGAFLRTVTSRIAAANSGVWLEGPALLSDSGVTLVHPAMHTTIFGRLRRTIIEDDQIRLVPSGLLEVTEDGMLRGVGGALADDVELTVHAILLPAAPNDLMAVRRLLDMTRDLDQQSFNGALQLAKMAPVYDVDLVMSVEELVTRIKEIAI